MSDQPTTKTTLLELVSVSHATWTDVIGRISPDDFARPGTIGEFSVKDITAHLNGWRTLTTDRLESAAREVEPPPFPWPDGMSEETEEGTDEINAYFQDQSRDRPATELLAESEDQFNRIRVAILAISEDDLLTPGRYAWMHGHPLGAVIEGMVEHLDVDHIPGILAWLESRSDG